MNRYRNKDNKSRRMIYGCDSRTRMPSVYISSVLFSQSYNIVSFGLEYKKNIHRMHTLIGGLYKSNSYLTFIELFNL